MDGFTFCVVVVVSDDVVAGPTGVKVEVDEDVAVQSAQSSQADPL